MGDTFILTHTLCTSVCKYAVCVSYPHLIIHWVHTVGVKGILMHILSCMDENLFSHIIFKTFFWLWSILLSCVGVGHFFVMYSTAG